MKTFLLVAVVTLVATTMVEGCRGSFDYCDSPGSRGNVSIRFYGSGYTVAFINF